MHKNLKFNKSLYFCTECKTIISSIDKLFFIEEKSTKGFCSENCIEDFYMPLIRHYENIERTMRTKLGIEDEQIDHQLSHNELIDDILKKSCEIWIIKNELEEEIFTFIKEFNGFYGFVICKVYGNQASIILLTALTRSIKLLSEVRSGEKINSKENDQFQNNDENKMGEEFGSDDFNFVQLLENKKSILLAELIEKRKESDIAFENFSIYESCFSETLDTPDEVFETKDNEGDLFFIYLKSFLLQGETIVYIISCLKRKEDDDSPEVKVFPVLAFPTNDLELCSEFRSGKRISGHLNN